MNKGDFGIFTVPKILKKNSCMIFELCYCINPFALNASEGGESRLTDVVR
jgi:hypothetical protein